MKCIEQTSAHEQVSTLLPSTLLTSTWPPATCRMHMHLRMACSLHHCICSDIHAVSMVLSMLYPAMPTGEKHAYRSLKCLWGEAASRLPETLALPPRHSATVHTHHPAPPLHERWQVQLTPYCTLSKHTCKCNICWAEATSTCTVRCKGVSPGSCVDVCMATRA